MVSSSINCKHTRRKLLFCVGLFFINEAYAGDDPMCSYASFTQQRMDQVTASVSDTDLKELNNLSASHVNGTCGYSYNEEKSTIAYGLIENNVNNGVYWPGIIEYAKFNESLDTPDNILYAEIFYDNFEGVIDLPALRMLIDVFVKSNNI